MTTFSFDTFGEYTV